MRVRLIVCVLSLLVAAPLQSALAQPAPAASDSAARQSLAKETVDFAHGRAAMMAWRKMLMQSAGQMKCACDDATRERLAASWLKAVDTSFDEARMLARIETLLAEAVDARTLDRWNAFYRAPLGRKIHIAETPDLADRSPEQVMAELKRWRQQLDRAPERKDLVNRIVAATDNVAGSVDFVLAISLGSAIGTNAMLPRNMPRMETADLLAAVETQRPIVQSAMEDAVPGMLAKSYRGLSIAELKGYVAELTSPNAQRMVRALRAAFRQAMQEQAIVIGGAFAKELTATEM